MKKFRQVTGTPRFLSNFGKVFILSLVAVLFISGCSPKKESSGKASEDTGDKPDTWIADRTITGLVFMSDDDASKEMNPEIAAELKKRTGITLELQTVSSDSSLQALTAGIAAGDLPEFIAYYLNNSGRPEMQVLLKAAREGMFTDLTPYMKDSKVYSKYFEDDYLPLDTKNNIMFRPEFDGSTYMVHMTIPREAGYESRKYVGGPYIRKDIADELGITPSEINTSEKMYELAKKIKAGNFKDENGRDITPIGPTIWGGSDRDQWYRDMIWTGNSGEKFFRDPKDGKIKHESQTDYGIKRIEYVQKLMKEKLMHPEFYTMEENRAKEGVINKSFGIVADMHNFVPENSDMKYIPLGPLNSIEGEYQMELAFKSGYSGWSIPSTTKNPEDIVKFADYLASREGKLLSWYGIEGRDYTLDENGNPLVKQEVLDLLEKEPDAAKELGFRGVRSYWAEHLGYTDLDREADFGEAEYGEAVSPNVNKAAADIIKMWKYDEKFADAKIVDGYTPGSFIFEVEGGEDLDIALKNYNESLLRAFYSKNLDDAKDIMKEAAKQLERAGLKEYIQTLEEKDKHEETRIKY
ncbi:extracellular solute-binding protein [Lederbergia citrea]|uniref:extracellular solute-binding protein n=1 Tax=Lederbergia citrea TaxID=2833581 RepID=UPI001BCA07A0|nr:extracellular solute-binding protein [Lederbergia citrea]MBS4179553.1 extracellular solute-binding protein [Lederbergia citrea]